MVNKSEVVVNNKHYVGSMIDIDTILRTCPANFSKDITTFKDCIEKAHYDEKHLFFSLLRSTLLENS